MAILTGQIVIDADKGIVVLMAIATLYLCRTGIICRRPVVALHESVLAVVRRRAGPGRRVIAVVCGQCVTGLAVAPRRGRVTTFDGTTPDEFALAPNGWSEWLREG